MTPSDHFPMDARLTTGKHTHSHAELVWKSRIIIHPYKTKHKFYFLRHGGGQSMGRNDEEIVPRWGAWLLGPSKHRVYKTVPPFGGHHDQNKSASGCTSEHAHGAPARVSARRKARGDHRLPRRFSDGGLHKPQTSRRSLAPSLRFKMHQVLKFYISRGRIALFFFFF